MKRLIRRVKSWFARQSWTVFGFDLPALLGRFMEYFGIGRLERVIKRWLARRQWKIFWSCLPVLLAAFLSVFILAVVLLILGLRIEVPEEPLPLAPDLMEKVNAKPEAGVGLPPMAVIRSS